MTVFDSFSDFTEDCEEINGTFFCGGVEISDGGGGSSPSIFSDFASVFALAGSSNYSGTREFIQFFLEGSPLSIPAVGEVTFNINIDFTNKNFCVNTCTIVVNTGGSFGGNISDSTTINTLNYGGFIGTATNIFTDADLSNSNFAGTFGGLVDFDNGTTVTIANNLSIEVFYNDGGNIGSTTGDVVTDPGVLFTP